MVNKIINLRVFQDNQDKMNLSINDIKGEVLIVSQFTLYGDTTKGNRPSFIDSANKDIAFPIYKEFIKIMRKKVEVVETGKFASKMEVELINDGPITLIINI